MEYLNVTQNKAALDRMLAYSKGKRLVPVIVEGKTVRLGYEGGS